jgi:hypothetical protein
MPGYGGRVRSGRLCDHRADRIAVAAGRRPGALRLDAGLAFLALLGWRFIPTRNAPAAGELFGMATYVTEAKVKEGSKSIGKAFTELEQLQGVPDAHVLGRYALPG